MTGIDRFRFRLALALGMTVGELSARMSMREFNKWFDYYQIEPFGQWRDNWNVAQIAAMYAAVHAKNPNDVSFEDYMFHTVEERREKETKKTIAFLDAHAVPIKKVE